jgi:hypothetical protein
MQNYEALDWWNKSIKNTGERVMWKSKLQKKYYPEKEHYSHITSDEIKEIYKKETCPGRCFGR